MRSEGYGSCRVCLSLTLGAHAPEGYGSWVCVCVCVSVMRELTSPVIERVKNKLTYPAADEGQKICGIFSETALFKSYGVKKPTS